MQLSKTQGVIAVGAKIVKQEGIDPSEYANIKEGQGLLLARLGGFSAIFFYEGNTQLGSFYRSETVDKIIVENKEFAPQILIGCNTEEETRVVIPSHLQQAKQPTQRNPSSDMSEYRELLERSKQFGSREKAREFDAGSLQGALTSNQPREVKVEPIRIQFRTVKVSVIDGLTDQIDPEFMVQIALQQGVIDEDLFNINKNDLGTPAY